MPQPGRAGDLRGQACRVREAWGQPGTAVGREECRSLSEERCLGTMTGLSHEDDLSPHSFRKWLRESEGHCR